jgi:hypothetical protein
VGSDIGNVVVTLSTAGTGLLAEQALKVTKAAPLAIEAGNLIYRGLQGQLTPNDLLSASEDALTTIFEFELPATAQYVFNQKLLPFILAGPQFFSITGSVQPGPDVIRSPSK